MLLNNPLQDKYFLRVLDNQQINFYYAKIIVLNMEEIPIEEITGRITTGSININGDSSVRRTCSLSFVALEEENNLTNVDSLLSINKKISVEIGVTNNTGLYPEHEIIWFPQGIYVICQPSISHSNTGVTISLSCKDKMCLLNGECGGGLPAPIVFDSYDQVMDDGTIQNMKQTVYHVIQTLVCNYGGEALSKIFVNDVPLEIKQTVRYVGSTPLYYDTSTDFYTLNKNYADLSTGTWKIFEYNENVGYVFTDFVYPGELQSGIGENVCSVLDKIISILGNYEYFYDIKGNFIFQEKKNYLNNSYDPTDAFRLDNNRKVEIASNNLSILDGISYQVDFNSNKKTIYDFDEGSPLIQSYSNAPVYSNIKNDFHIWGKGNNSSTIHYHLVIKDKPAEMGTYGVIFEKDANGEYTGKLRLALHDDYSEIATIEGDTLKFSEDSPAAVNIDHILELWSEGVRVIEDNHTLLLAGPDVEMYTPEDWRAEIYLQGLEKKHLGIRPDVYEQELLDLFDNIYDFYNKEFKTDMVNNPNALNYFIDYLPPSSKLADISVDSLYPKVHSYQQDNIRCLYSNDVPNIILIDVNEDFQRRKEIVDRCEREGQPYANVDSTIYTKLAQNIAGYSAQDVARDLLYQYTHYNENITVQSKPIYYLEPNCRISVYDKKAGISGDYVVKTMTLPLDGKSPMNISASKVIDRI